MPTTVTKTIGSGGGRDYSTPQTWENALPANLVTGDVAHVGELYNDSEFTAASTLLLISGQTTDSTRNITLKCASGQSFRDHASVRSNALFYNASNGVGLRITGSYTYCVRVESQYVTLDGLQISAPDTGGGIGVQWNASNFTMRNCIVYARQPLSISGGPSGATMVNCLFVARSGGLIGTAGGGTRFEFCTIVRTSSGGTVGTASYATLTVENCAIFNFTTGFTAGTGGTVNGGYNCTDLGSAPGSNNQVSKTFSSQFENTASDFRAKSGGSMVNGTPATTYATVDISNTSRDATTPTIGCWELASAGGPATVVAVSIWGRADAKSSTPSAAATLASVPPWAGLSARPSTVTGAVALGAVAPWTRAASAPATPSGAVTLAVVAPPSAAAATPPVASAGATVASTEARSAAQATPPAPSAAVALAVGPSSAGARMDQLGVAAFATVEVAAPEVRSGAWSGVPSLAAGAAVPATPAGGRAAAASSTPTAGATVQGVPVPARGGTKPSAVSAGATVTAAGPWGRGEVAPPTVTAGAIAVLVTAVSSWVAAWASGGRGAWLPRPAIRVPDEERTVAVATESRAVTVPAESRVVDVPADTEE